MPIDPPGATVTPGSGAFSTVKGPTGSTTPVTVNIDTPVCMNVIVVFEGGAPIESVPKSTDGGVAVIGTVDATPSPSRGRLTAPGASVLAVSVPDCRPSAAGVNVKGTVRVSPA